MIKGGRIALIITVSMLWAAQVIISGYYLISENAELGRDGQTAVVLGMAIAVTLSNRLRKCTCDHGHPDPGREDDETTLFRANLALAAAMLEERTRIDDTTDTGDARNLRAV